MNNNKIEYISLASVISAIAVVFLHTNGCFWQFSTARYWITANIIESVFYFAVPIFFMISGAMLLDFNERYDLEKYFSKRISKTLIPYIVWSFIGLFLEIFCFSMIKLSDVNIVYIINGLLNGSLVNVYWFFIPLFCIYLSIPIFASINNKKNILIYATTLTFILNILIPFLISVFNLDINFSISMIVVGGSLFYTLTGYLLHKYEMDRKYQLILYSLAVFGLLIHICGTYYASFAAGEVVKTYKDYNNLPATLYSLGIFVFIKYDLIKIMKFSHINSLVNFLNSYTFGIYLIHWYILEIIIEVFNINITSIVFRLIAPFFIILISIVVIQFIRKIPFIKKIVP